LPFSSNLRCQFPDPQAIAFGVIRRQICMVLRSKKFVENPVSENAGRASVPQKQSPKTVLSIGGWLAKQKMDLQSKCQKS
jgi:hypothetical protein